MSDDFLSGLRQEPSAEFAQQLKARLRRLDAPARRFVPSTLARWTALAASFGLVAFSFTFPAVRAGAQAFLESLPPWIRNPSCVSYEVHRRVEIRKRLRSNKVSTPLVTFSAAACQSSLVGSPS